MTSLLHASAGHSLRPALAVLFALLLAACAQASAPAAPVATDQVDLPRSYRFAPEDITVPAGTEVTWTNNDNFTHSVRLLDSDEVQMMKPGESVSHTFAAPGLFRYDCSLHPKDMHGSVLVGGGGGQAPFIRSGDGGQAPATTAFDAAAEGGAVLELQPAR